MATRAVMQSSGSSVPSRRRVIRALGIGGTAILAGRAIRGAGTGLRIAGTEVEIALTSVSAHTVRITVRPVLDGKPLPAVADDGALAQTNFGSPVKARTNLLGNCSAFLRPRYLTA